MSASAFGRQDWHLRDCEDAQTRFALAEADLREAVQAAVLRGVPLLVLSKRLGVSRTRIRTLARGGDSR